MNPELTTSLAAQHRRELTSEATAYRALVPQPRRSGLRRVAPYRVTWTRVRLALSDGGRPSTSWTIVISATRAR
jgi:hypothetical protein